MLLPAALLMSLALGQQTPPQSQPQSPPAPVGALADAGSGASSQTGTAGQEPPAGPARVCRIEPVTGSRFGRQVCRNRVETAADRRESQEMLRRMQGARVPDVH